MRVKITIELEEDGKRSVNKVVEMEYIRTKTPTRAMEVALGDAFVEALETFETRNAPGTSRNNPIVVSDWSQVDKPGYYSHVNSPGWWVNVEENNWRSDPTYYTLTCKSFNNASGVFFPLASSQTVRTWKTVKGAVRYIENQLSHYWQKERLVI